jgi:hypothetical protein
MESNRVAPGRGVAQIRRKSADHISSRTFLRIWQLFLDEHSVTRKRIDYLLIFVALGSLLYMPWSLAFWSYVEEPHMSKWRHIELLSDIIFIFAAITETLTRTQAAKKVSRTENRRRSFVRSSTGMDLLKKRSGHRSGSRDFGNTINKNINGSQTLPRMKETLAHAKKKNRANGSMKRIEDMCLGIGGMDEHSSPGDTNATVHGKRISLSLLWLSACPFQYLQELNIPLHMRRWLQLVNLLKMYRLRAVAQHYHRLQVQ